MTPASALYTVWQETKAAFAGSGYVLFCIEAHVVCIIILAILFNRQQNSSDQTETDIIWSRLLMAQILHCITCVCMVLESAGVIPYSYASMYVLNVLDLGLLSAICLMVFLYTEHSQKSGFLDSLAHKILAPFPFVVSIIILLAYPYFSDGDTGMMPIAVLRTVLAVSLVYPLMSVVFAMFRRRKMTRFERETSHAAAMYPVLLLVVAPIQTLNWRMPLLCYVIVVADLFIYISHVNSLILVDPLTQIPNRNGLMQALAERLEQGSPEQLHVFAVDIDDMSLVNSSRGRIEGDHALMLVANALKKFRDTEHQCYVSRYYGDEFVLTADIQDDEERELFIEHIHNYVSNAATADRLPYHLRVSVGWSKYEQFSRTETISGLIEEADRAMTDDREQRKFQTLWDKA